MGKFKFISSGILAASLISTGCFAADLPIIKEPIPVPAPPRDWSGCYLGAFGGWTFNHTSTSMAGVDTVTTTSRGRTTKTVTNVAAAGGNEFDGGEFGGRVGCQRQFGQFVIGGEISGGGQGLEGTPNLTNARGTLYGTARFRGGGFGEAALKLGYALNDRAMVFLKGGAIFIDAETSFFDSKSNYLGHISNGGALGTIGGGAEYRVNDRVSVTAEYNYLSGRCGSLAFSSNVTSTETFVGSAHSCMSQSAVTVGLNYYFPTSWWVGPVIAKY